MKLIGMLAETFIHPGSGQSTGVVDLPVAREAATDYPFIAGSSLKGALRDKIEQEVGKDDALVKTLFGLQDNAGHLMVSDARLVLLPVRSLTGQYKWATCPHLIERFLRDGRRSGVAAGFAPPEVAPGSALTAESGKIFIEERTFTVTGPVPADVIAALETLIAHAETRARLDKQVAILHDDDFAWFARYGLAIQARNQLSENKTSENLWYEETLQPDTVMYAVLGQRSPDAIEKLVPRLAAKPYLQAGGNETVGHGWFALTI